MNTIKYALPLAHRIENDRDSCDRKSIIIYCDDVSFRQVGCPEAAKQKRLTDRARGSLP